MRTRICVTLAALVLPLLVSATARAEGTTCAQPSVIVPDGRIVVGTIPSATTFIFLFDSVAGRQYSVELKSVFGNFDTPAFPGAFIISSVTSGICANSITPAPTDTAGIEPLIPGASGRRVSFTAADTRHRILFLNQTLVTQTYSLSVSDTTLFSPAYSTNGTYNTFYSFFNTTNSSLSGTLILTNLAGAVVTTMNLNLPPNATTSTNTASLGTPRSSTGAAIFIHNGPPGAIMPVSAIANFTLVPTPYFQFVPFASAREGPH